MFDVFIFFIPMSQTIDVINKSGACFFCMHQISDACAGMCTCNHTHEMNKTASKKNCFICFNDSLSKMMKNAFHFILKALFILKIFKFLSWLFGHVEKMAWLDVTTWLRNNYNTNCPISHEIKVTSNEIWSVNRM